MLSLDDTDQGIPLHEQSRTDRQTDQGIPLHEQSRTDRQTMQLNADQQLVHILPAAVSPSGVAHSSDSRSPTEQADATELPGLHSTAIQHAVAAVPGIADANMQQLCMPEPATQRDAAAPPTWQNLSAVNDGRPPQHASSLSQQVTSGSLHNAMTHPPLTSHLQDTATPYAHQHSNAAQPAGSAPAATEAQSQTSQLPHHCRPIADQDVHTQQAVSMQISATAAANTHATAEDYSAEGSCPPSVAPLNEHAMEFGLRPPGGNVSAGSSDCSESHLPNETSTESSADDSHIQHTGHFDAGVPCNF